MKFSFPLIAAFVAITSLSACGGNNDPVPSVPVASPALTSSTDVVVGTGAPAVAGNTVTVQYTGWLYTATAPNKGTQFDTSVGKTAFEFKLGAVPLKVIAGFDKGVTDMKVGGKRTVLIAAADGYGAAGAGSGSTAIPPNSGLVFDIELVAVKP